MGLAEGLELDGGWGRVSLASQEILFSSAGCQPGLRLAPPSKVGSGSPGTICCWRGEGRVSAGLGKRRARDGSAPLRSRKLRCFAGREAHEKTRLRTWFGFLFPLPLTDPDASGRRRGHKGKLRQPPRITLGLEYQIAGPPPPLHTNLCPHPSSRSYHQSGGQGRIGLGSQFFIKRSKGLKTRASQDPRERPPHT